jgi:hypothetical protein
MSASPSRHVISVPQEPESFLERHKQGLFLIGLFIVTFLSARFAIQPINDHDYVWASRSAQALLSGQDPYGPGRFNMPP